MENTNKNTELKRSARIEKIAGLFFSVAILLLVDILIIYAMVDSEKNPFNGNWKKLLLIAVGNFIYLLLLFLGDWICKKAEDTLLFKIADVLLLLVTPVAVLIFVQMIAWQSGYKNKAVSSIKGLIGSAMSMTGADIFWNLLIYFLIFALLILLFRKVGRASVVFGYLMVILALVNYFVMEFRGEPFFILDIVGVGTAAEVAGEYTFKLPLLAGFTLICALVFVQFAARFQKLELGKKSRKNTICRMGVLAGAAIALVLSFKPVLQKTENVYLWNVNKDYRNRGYVYTLVREIRYIFVEQPEGYSADRVTELAEGLEKETEEKNGSAASSEVVQPKNIIMIMNESLADFESVGEIATNAQILPFIHSLDKNVKHGNLHMPTFGGGTARSEYEALTGNSMTFLPAGCVPYQLYVREPEYGMADILKSQGYYTIAMHPNKARNWNRDNVYPDMGFDEFISLQNWGDEYRDKIRNNISDQATYDKIISLYENKGTHDKLFTFCVTMQNHGGYTESTLNGFEPGVKLNYDQDYPLAETYLSLAQESDKAFQNLLEYFEKVDEPTMIVMFGDHWPKIEENFMAEVLGKNRQNLSLEESQITYATPYVIWTNYPSETVEEDFSANYLGSYVLQLARAQMTGYNQFLLNIKEQLPIIGVGAVRDKDGNWYATEKLPKEYQELLTNYNILEYNNQFEKKNVAESLFTLGN